MVVAPAAEQHPGVKVVAFNPCINAFSTARGAENPHDIQNSGMQEKRAVVAIGLNTLLEFDCNFVSGKPLKMPSSLWLRSFINTCL